MYLSLVRDMGSKEVRKRFTGWNLYDRDYRHVCSHFTSTARMRHEKAIRKAMKANPRS